MSKYASLCSPFGGVWITRIHIKFSHITSIYNPNVSLQKDIRQRWENFPKFIGKLAWHTKPQLRDPATENWKEDKDQHLEVGLSSCTGALWHVCTHTHTEEQAQHTCVQVSARGGGAGRNWGVDYQGQQGDKITPICGKNRQNYGIYWGTKSVDTHAHRCEREVSKEPRDWRVDLELS